MKQSLISLCIILSCMYCNGQSNADISKVEAKTDTLYISMNDKLLFDVEVDSNNHLSFKKAGAKSSEAKTISITLTFSEGIGTLLKIQNPFSKVLSYKAELYGYKKKDYLETSTIPIEPNLSSFETWPYRIDKMRLSGFILKSAD